MLRNTKRSSIRHSVKLFPRLATAKATQTLVRLDRPLADGRDKVVVTTNKRDVEATRVRARLLRMILDNERVRRHEWRPNAS